MAEAAAGASLDRALKSVKGDVFSINDDGTYTISLTFNPYRFKRHVLRALFRVRQAVFNMIWPLNPVIFAGGVTGVVVKVLSSPSGSWWRSGGLAEFLWKVDNLLPWEQGLPVQARVAGLSLWAAITGLVGISFVQRSVLRTLLQYQGWMWLEHGQKLTVLQKLWFMSVKVLSGTKPSLYNFQGCLPSLPVPNLKGTTTKWLDSVKPLLNDAEYKEMENKVEKFLKNEGWKLQMMLYIQSMYKTSWLWDWWEKYVYLRGRAPIMINSNYYIIDSLDWVPTTNQAARTAGLLNQADKFKSLVDWERLEPMRLQKTIPWCMKQYERIFDTTRVPGRECDVVNHYELDPERYCAVTRKGVWYKLAMTGKGKNGKWRTALPHELEQQIAWIMQDADARPAPEGENAIAAFTGWHRGRWAESREEFFWEGLNKESLDIVERAFMHFSLNDTACASLTDQARMLMHSDGKTTWFDKSVTFNSFPDGHAGMSAEHSFADALTVAHMWEWCTTGERLQGGIYREDGHCKGFEDTAFEQVALKPPKRLSWDVSPPMIKSIQEAVAHNVALISDLDLNVFKHETFGKGFMKKAKISPDAFFQIAMQLAYRMDAGKPALTYEASVTRLFAQGRTETVRSLSIESAAFVDAMLSQDASDAERVAKLSAAADKHASLYKHAMVGGGIDRHLFGLYVTSVGLGYDSDFLKSALKMPWTLSTSQTPQKQTEGRWNPEGSDACRISPGGGFGPVAENGYGVSYMFGNDNVIFVHVSSKHSAVETDSKRFERNIVKALGDIKRLVETDMAAKAAAKNK
mmetsp:Transcript_59715/g.141984  ORF Transcript_59715/g.141984 Transcript_59715/m.141984 type:complete len:801 (+) Transcript_59715:97-2499(+)